MAKNKENLVDEGFRVSLVETAFFDGKFEIPHIDAPDKIIIPNGMVPFSVRERIFTGLLTGGGRKNIRDAAYSSEPQTTLNF